MTECELHCAIPSFYCCRLCMSLWPASSRMLRRCTLRHCGTMVCGHVFLLLDGAGGPHVSMQAVTVSQRCVRSSAAPTHALVHFFVIVTIIQLGQLVTGCDCGWWRCPTTAEWICNLQCSPLLLPRCLHCFAVWDAVQHHCGFGIMIAATSHCARRVVHPQRLHKLFCN